MPRSRLICFPTLSCQNHHHPNLFNAKDMWHKPGLCPGGPVPRCSTDLSQITLLIFPFPFHFHRPPSPDSFPLTTLHCLLSFTSLCHTDDLLLCPRPSVSPSSFSFPLPAFWFPLSFCVSVSGASLDIFRSLFCRYLSEVSAGLHAYLRVAVSPLWACSEVSNPPVCKTWPPKSLVLPSESKR